MSSLLHGLERRTADLHLARLFPKLKDRLERDGQADFPSCLRPEPEFAVRISHFGEPFHYFGSSLYEEEPEELMDLDAAMLATAAAKEVYGQQVHVEVVHEPTGRVFRTEKYVCQDDSAVVVGILENACQNRNFLDGS